MADNGSRKITRYPKNLNNINIGMIFFAVMALYIVISVITYMRKDHIVGYQVNEGSLSSNNIYEALVIRKEEEVDSDAAGYVNYFQTEGSRVAVGNLVYTLDESGQLLEYLNHKDPKMYHSVMRIWQSSDLRSLILILLSMFAIFIQYMILR